MRFFTHSYRPDQTVTPCGRRELETFQFLPDPETGDRKLFAIGKTDLYEKAQQSRPDDLYTLLKNSGVEPSDIESLQITKEYASHLIDDFCSAPRSLLEAHEVIHRAEASFDALPLAVKEEFGNSSGQMLKSLVDGTFEKRISRFIPVQNEKDNVSEAQDEIK